MIATNGALITGWFTVAGSAVTGVLTYFVTSRSIRASDRQSEAQRSHDAEQREADRLTQLQAVQLAAHDASIRRSYIVIQTFIRFTDSWVVWMRASVVSGSEGEMPEPPSDTEAAYAEIDLTISGPARDVYLRLRSAQTKLEEAYAAVKDEREMRAYGPGPATRKDVREVFFSANDHFNKCSEVMTEQLRADLDPATLK